MSVGLSADVKRHLARVYAILAACILTSTGSCAALLALVPWVPPYTYVVLGVSLMGLIIGVIAFACMPRERFVARYALLMAMCAFGGTFFAFFVQAALAEDPAIVTTTLSMTALIFVSFSASAILTPQKEVLMYMVALALAIVTLAVFSLVLSIFSIFVYSSALQQVYTFAALAVFSLYIAWETEMTIQRASEGDRDPVGDAASLFSVVPTPCHTDMPPVAADLIDIFIRVASCVASAKSGDGSGEKAPLLEGSVA